MGRKVVVLGGIFTFFFIFVIVVIGPLLIIGWYLPQLTNKNALIHSKADGVLLYDRNNNLLATFGSPLRRTAIENEKIPESIKHAVISMEDRNYYHHHGFSFKGIARAIVRNVQRGRLSEGGSTITQQFIKNTLLTPEKSIVRKYNELILALMLERLYDKESILSLYLNTIYFGEGAYGVEEATQTYFGKSASELTISESAYLAGIIAAPSAYKSEEQITERKKIVVETMIEQGYLTEDKKNEIISEPLVFKNAHDNTLGIAPHFALYVYDQLIERYGKEKALNSGLKVTTTLDSSMQEIAQQTLKDQVNQLRYRSASNGSVVVLDPDTGEILAMVGSHNWDDAENGKINMATTSRQVGSSFKPIVYAAAFERGILTPATLLPDLPATYPTAEGPWKPLDYDRRFRGPVLPRRALANSLNLPAVAVMNKVGITTGLSYAKSFGISSLKDSSSYGLSFVLGAVEIPLLDMTRAYAVFANDGKRSSITAIQKITNKGGKDEYVYKPKKETVVSETTAFIINSILSDQQGRSEVFGNLLNTRVRAAVKTGTTENYRDSLTLGYTPNLVIGVWVGNNDNRPMDTVAGSLGAAPIFRDLMDTFSKDRPVEEFSKPSSIAQKVVCATDSMLPFDATPSAVREYMIAGKGDNQSCKKEVADLTSQNN